MKALPVIILPAAQRDIKALDQQKRKRILSSLDDFSDGKPVDIKKLQGNTGHWRIRVGDYRIILDIVLIDNVAYVLKVRHRREVYR